MHTFQPYPIDLLEMNPFTKIGKEWALVTAGSKAKCNTMTVSWGGVGVIWNKNVVYIFVRDSRYTKEFIDQGEFFSLSFLDEKYRNALNYCGSHSGREENKFEKAGFHAIKSEFVDAPIIQELSFALECSMISYDEKTCRLVGKIQNVNVDEKILTADGKIDVSKLNPIVYDPANHDYLKLGAKVGNAFKDGLQLK